MLKLKGWSRNSRSTPAELILPGQNLRSLSRMELSDCDTSEAAAHTRPCGVETAACSSKSFDEVIQVRLHFPILRESEKFRLFWKHRRNARSSGYFVMPVRRASGPGALPRRRTNYGLPRLLGIARVFIVLPPDASARTKADVLRREFTILYWMPIHRLSKPIAHRNSIDASTYPPERRSSRRDEPGLSVEAAPAFLLISAPVASEPSSKARSVYSSHQPPKPVPSQFDPL